MDRKTGGMGRDLKFRDQVFAAFQGTHSGRYRKHYETILLHIFAFPRGEKWEQRVKQAKEHFADLRFSESSGLPCPSLEVTLGILRGKW